MLLQLSRAPDSPESLRGVESTVEYLQRLGKEHLGLILEYSTWVLQCDPEKGLAVSKC